MQHMKKNRPKSSFNAIVEASKRQTIIDILIVSVCLLGVLWLIQFATAHRNDKKVSQVLTDSTTYHKKMAEYYASLPGYTIDGGDMSLIDVLTKLEDQGLVWHMDAQSCADSNNFHRLSMHLFKRPAQEIMDTIFKQEPSLYYEFKDDFYLIRLKRLKGRW